MVFVWFYRFCFFNGCLLMFVFVYLLCATSFVPSLLLVLVCSREGVVVFSVASTECNKETKPACDSCH